MSEAELAAFADGSLPPRRRAHVAACIEHSSELRVLVGEQRAALEAVRALAGNGSRDARIHDGLLPAIHRPVA